MAAGFHVLDDDRVGASFLGRVPFAGRRVVSLSRRDGLYVTLQGWCG